MALELHAQVREVLGKKVKSLRKKGIIPAVLYGEKTKSLPLEIDYKKFEKIYEEAGESTILKLKIHPVIRQGAPPRLSNGVQSRRMTGSDDGAKSKADIKNVLIYDVARDPVSDKFIHVDFYEVRMDKPITAEVSLVFEGESPAVAVEEGVLVKNITEVEVEALPADLPREIKVDISALKTFDDLIHIKDLKVSSGVKILAEPEEVVVSITPPRTEEELAALEEKVEEKVEEVEKIEKPFVVEAAEGKEKKAPAPAKEEVEEKKE